MSADDFFKKVDQKLESMDSAKEANKKSKQETYDFMAKAMNEITPMLKSYEYKLKEKGIRCEMTVSERGFSLNMNYKDGGHHAVSFGEDRDSARGHYTYTGRFTDDDGKNYKSAGSSRITQDNWSAAEAEKEIQKCINDFLFYADRHEGY